MTLTQAEEIMKILKKNHTYIKDDTEDSLVTHLNYDETGSAFIVNRQDTIVGYLFPETKYDEESFKTLLMNEYDFDDAIRNMYKS